MMLVFRKLRADEIDARVAQISEKGLSLLLYKDARCDMRLLDETVGPMNWQREHVLIDGQLFCRIGIRGEDGAYVWKEDVGTVSNTEAEKGRASDAFKRACFNWGIGRELYTAPFIWIPAGNYSAFQDKGKWKTYDRFRVTDIGYDEDGNIVAITIINQKTRKKVYELGPSEAQKRPETEKAHNSTPEAVEARETHLINARDWKVLQTLIAGKGKDAAQYIKDRGFDKPAEITAEAYVGMLEELRG